MNKDQLAMLSVKSAIERTVQAYISVYSQSSDYKGFFAEVERYVASLFVSRQISNNYSVRTTTKGDVEIKFVANGQYSSLLVLLPNEVRWKDEALQFETFTAPPSPPPVPAIDHRSGEPVNRYGLTDEERFNAIVPQLEEQLKQLIFEPNTSVTRERIKKTLANEVTKLLTPKTVFITCDETNNSLQDRELGNLFVEVETIISTGGPLIAATLTVTTDMAEFDGGTQEVAPVDRKIPKTDPVVLHAVGTFCAVVTGTDLTQSVFDIGEHLRSTLTKKLINVADFKIELRAEEDEIHFVFSIKPYEERDWVSYPFTESLDA